jgi:hypothetical protein
MEVVAHALWATAAAKAVNRTDSLRIRTAWFAFWSVFPDLFAFAPAVAAVLWYRLSGASQVHAHVHHLLGVGLYDLSHSLIVFAPLFAAVCVAFRRPVWCMLGWALHILMDIPTHSAHFPTPFLWPVSCYRFIGVSWWSWQFMALSYTALALVYVSLWKSRRPERAATEAPPR